MNSDHTPDRSSSAPGAAWMGAPAETIRLNLSGDPEPAAEAVDWSGRCSVRGSDALLTVASAAIGAPSAAGATATGAAAVGAGAVPEVPTVGTARSMRARSAAMAPDCQAASNDAVTGKRDASHHPIASRCGENTRGVCAEVFHRVAA